MTAIAARRRSRWATPILVALGLMLTGAGYAAVAPGQASATSAAASANQVEQGKKLFLANCATCHGLDATGTGVAPSLVGVGAAAVDFQVGTGRMPMQATGPQAMASGVLLSPEETAALSAYVASLGAGPAIPTDEMADGAKGDPSRGALIFRTNCAMCHNFAGMGGALTRGKYAPTLEGVSEKHIYEAMVSGPQSMPVFNDMTIDPQGKRDIIAYIQTAHDTPAPGGFALGSLGPVSEGLAVWVVAMSLLVGFAVWLGAKAA